MKQEDKMLEKNHFYTKEKIVLAGGSKILSNWQKHSTVTVKEFLEALEWLCKDPLTENGYMTREIALTPYGVKKLRRVTDVWGLVYFYDWYTGLIWSGEVFERPSVTEKEKCFFGDTVKELQKISISCKDHI